MITEVHQSLGSWEIRLREDTPRHILDALTYFGHVAVMPGKADPVQYGDNLLPKARYVGVLRERDKRNDLILRGSGLAFWLGDEDDKGDIFETPVVLSGATFANAVRALLPPNGGVAEGTIHSVPGTYSGRHQWQTPRKALTYVTDTFGAEFRLRGHATDKVVLDAGTVSQLFVTTPTALLLPKGAGRDLFQVALPGQMQMQTNVGDLTTRVVLLAEGEGDAISTGAADAPPTAYKDLRGNPLKATRLISESETASGNAAARAQLQLNRFLNASRSVNLSTSAYDVKGTFSVGDYLNVYDPENGFYDLQREIYWMGYPINPMALRCVEMTWPVPEGFTVGFRDIDGKWIDLSPYYAPESGETQIVVGSLSRSLTSIGAEPVGVRPNLPVGDSVPDTTIPGAPTWGDISTGSYQPTTGEWTKAAVFLKWNQPLNLDGSTITDGAHYEIRYRINTYIGYKVRWGALSAYRWGELSGNRWGAPITDPVNSSQEWHTVYVGWGQTQTLIQELTPGVEYEFQIRAVDSADPPNRGPWSASEFVVASEDLFAPSTPAPPVVASSRIAIQVVHLLGRADGGTFNLQPDLAYLSVHVGGSSSFVVEPSNEVGKMVANAGMIQAQIPAVHTFQIEQTDEVWVRVVAVDRAGNKSGPSEAVQASVQLIDSAHISDLTVSKVTAGTISAQWIMAGAIKTAQSGARVEMTGAGIQAYRADGTKTVDIKGSDGSVSIIGRLDTKADGGGVSVVPGQIPYIRFRPNDSGSHYIDAFSWRDEGSSWGTLLDFSVRRMPDGNIDGGKLLMSQGMAILSHQPASAAEQFLGIGYPYPGEIYLSSPGAGDMTFFNDTGNFVFRGKFPNYQYANPKDAIFTMKDSGLGSGPVIQNYTYGPTMARVLYPIVSIKSNSDTMIRVTSETTTGFGVGISGGSGLVLAAWCVAME